MSDYQTQGCVKFSLTEEQHGWAFRLILQLCAYLNTEESLRKTTLVEIDQVPVVLTIARDHPHARPNYTITRRDDALMAMSDTNFEVDLTVAWIQAVMQHFNLDAPVGFTYAVAGTQDLFDPKRYSGGAVLVTKKNHWYVNATEWLNEELAELGRTKTFMADNAHVMSFGAVPDTGATVTQGTARPLTQYMKILPTDSEAEKIKKRIHNLNRNTHLGAFSAPLPELAVANRMAAEMADLIETIPAGALDEAVRSHSLTEDLPVAYANASGVTAQVICLVLHGWTFDQIKKAAGLDAPSSDTQSPAGL